MIKPDREKPGRFARQAAMPRVTARMSATSTPRRTAPRSRIFSMTVNWPGFAP